LSHILEEHSLTDTYGLNNKDHHNYRGMEKSRLTISLSITAVMLAVEVVGGIISNSLALLSDAGHMVTHLAALGISLLAIKFTEKEATNRMTFGFYRAEIVAALLNGVILFLLTIWVAYEAYGRFFDPRDINSVQMFWIASLGLIVNVATAVILKDASHNSINVRAAFLHMIGDTLSSVGVVAGAVAIYMKGWTFLDPILSVILCIPIVIWSYRLIMESVGILLEATPKGIDVGEVETAIMDIANVRLVHDIHIWTLTSGVYAMSAHVVVEDLHISESAALLEDINRVLLKKFSIGHSTIQFECGEECIYSCT